MDEIKSPIRDYIVEHHLNGDPRGLTDTADLQAVGILDSFSTVEMIAFLEERFDVEIETSRLSPDEYRTVNALAALVHERRGPTANVDAKR